jgi:hypothetical protein
MDRSDVIFGTICAVGDVAAYLENPEPGFEYVGPILQEADITFSQNERHYSNRKDNASQDGFTEPTTRFLRSPMTKY